ncbi:MAG: N-methyl-D-aspartate receptor NMDAR2C subunit [Gemmatimonadota bacterium]
MKRLERWRDAWAGLGLAQPEQERFDALLARYAEPHRAYHTVQHLDECFANFDLVRASAAQPAALELAIWFHDAIYRPRRGDNEQASADLAADELRAAGAPAELIRHVGALILATAHHDPPPPGDAELLADIDLAILGAPSARYAEYERQIRIEYRWVPSFVFRAKRAALLEIFLSRARIYSTPLLHDRLEPTARVNLATSLAKLRRP